MKIKIYFTLLFSVLFYSIGFGANDKPFIPKQVVNSPIINTVLPSFLKLPQDERNNHLTTTPYSLDTLSNTWRPILLRYPVLKDIEKIMAMSFDPIRFTLAANKDSVNLNEEIELTISAELIDISPSFIFTFEEQYNFAIKLLIPKGFIITGGNYFDYTKGKLSTQNPKMTFKIKGYFESETFENFRLLRGGYDANANSLFVEKAQLKLPFIAEKDSKSFSLLEEAVSGTQLSCRNARINVDFYGITKYPNSYKLKDISFNVKFSNSDFISSLKIESIESQFGIHIKKPNGNQANVIGTVVNVEYPSNYFSQVPNIKVTVTVPEDLVLENGDEIGISGSTFDKLSLKLDYLLRGSLSCNDITINYDSKFVFNCSYFRPPTPVITGTSSFCTGSTVNLSIPSCSNCSYFWYKNNSGAIFSTNNNVTVGNSGVYSVEYKVPLNNCPSLIASFGVSENITYNANLTTRDGSKAANITLGQSVELYSNCSNALSKWSTGDVSSTITVQPSTTSNYSVYCVNQGCRGSSSSITVTVNPAQCTKPSSPTIVGNLNILRDAETTLTGSCTTGTFSWADGEYPNSRVVKPLVTTTYLGYCTNNNCRSNATSVQVNVQAPVGAPSPPTITASPKSTITDGEVIKLTAKGCDNGGVTWNTTPETIGSSIEVSPSQTTTYRAKCTVDNKSSDYSSPLTITVTGPCSKPTAPSIVTNSGIIVPGESTNISANGCSGYVKWYLDNNEIATSVDFSATLPGAYKATCTNDCGVSDFSNIINIYLEPLKIIIDQPTPDVYLTQQYNLTAQGCNNGYVIWELPPSQGSTQVKYTNPISVTGPGVYKAICVLFADEWKNSGWVSLSVNLKPVDAPGLTRSEDGCLFPTQTILLTATGCTNAQFRWNDGTTSPSGTAYKTVGPGTYWVQCCSGTQCGSVSQLQICTKEPEPITISANKTEANHNEQVILNAEGCGWGIVHWIGPNGQTAQGREVTMYGPGRYEARCYYNDLNFGPWASLTVNVKRPGALTLSTSKQCVQDGESNSLSAVGCPSGNIVWEYLKNGVPQSAYGKRIDVMGPGTYTAYCISYGISGPGTTLTVSACVGNKPIVNTDKSWARPSEPVKVFLSGCNPNLGGHWIRITYPNGSQTTSFGSLTVMGPFTYEAGCMNSGGALMYGLVTGQVGLSSIDYIQVVANKNKVFPEEEVSLTAYGCDFGFVEWKIGQTIIREDNNSITTLRHYGAGEYFARCVGDYTKNREWVKVFVESAVGIAAIVTGPNRLCPGTTGVLFGTNCPSNYWYQWYLADRDHVGGAMQEFRLPQTAKVRCYKNDDTHVSAYTEFVIEPAFPVAFEARSNSPVALGGVLQLTATDLAENTATYNWTPPPGVSLPATVALNQRTVSVPDMKPEYNGTYTLKTIFQGCEMIKQVVVKSNTCENLYIKANNSESGAITTKLTPNGSSGGARLFKPHTLTVMNDDGNIPPNALFRWEFPAGMPALPLDLATASSVQTSKIGKYQVDVTIGNTTCPLEINLSGEQCNPIPDSYVCGTAPTAVYPLTTGPSIDNLAAWDVFTAADFNVTVTEITGGNASSGWNGRGYIGFNLMGTTPNGPPVALGIEVELVNVKVNDCYELTAGSVKTVYDPKWEALVDLDALFNLGKKIKDGMEEIVLMIKNFNGSAAEKAKIEAKIVEFNTLGSKIQAQDGILPSEVTAFKTSFDTFVTNATCSINSTSSTPGGRIQSSNCSITDLENSKDAVVSNADNSTKKPEGYGLWTNDPCNPSSLASFYTVTGISASDGYGIAKLNECIDNNKDLIYTPNVAGGECANPNGFNITYLGVWSRGGYDYHYFQIVNNTSHEVFYLTRHDFISCRHYNITSRTKWKNCNYVDGCANLWTRVSLDFGNSTGEDAAEYMANAFAGIMIAGVSAPALLEIGIEQALVEAVSLKKSDLIITLAETLVTCDCNTIEQYITQFGLNLIANQAFKSALALKMPGLSAAQLDAKIKLIARSVITKLNEAKFFNKTTAALNEFKNKVVSKWDDFKSLLERKALQRVGKKLDLLFEEALGGHSIARHGPQLTLVEMEQRVLGTHPTIQQSRSALRFDSDFIHEDAVNKAYTQYADEIEVFFAKPSNTYKEWSFEYGSKVGSGYTNTGTLNNPISQAVTSKKVTISFKRVTNTPKGYRLESAFPDIRIQ